jgi:hypothetical protein
MVEGSVVGTPSRLVLAATLRDAESGATRGQAKLEGSADSLPVLVDRLTGQLLLESAGRRDRALATLTPLPALRAYLDGLASRRRGDYDSAAVRFTRALSLDSTLAIAAMGLRSVAGWGYAGNPDAGRSSGGTRLAWRYRDRLRPVEQAILQAAGPAEDSPLADYIAPRRRRCGWPPRIPRPGYGWGVAFSLRPAHQPGRLAERLPPRCGNQSSWTPRRRPAHIHLIQLLLALGDSAELRRVVWPSWVATRVSSSPTTSAGRSRSTRIPWGSSGCGRDSIGCPTARSTTSRCSPSWTVSRFDARRASDIR